MKEIFKNGAMLWLRTIIVTLMCVFLCMSMSVLATALFTENIGYEAQVYKEGSEKPEFTYTHYDADGEDTKKAEYEEQGYIVSTQSIRSTLSGSGNVTFLVVTQLFNTLLTISFVYPNLWQLGAKDSNLVRFKHKVEDKFKGLKIGLLGSVPAFLMWIAFVVCKYAVPHLPSALYRFLNSSSYSFIYAICKDSTVGELSVLKLILLLLPLMIIPLTAFGAYLLGYKDISLGERFIYKKSKT